MNDVTSSMGLYFKFRQNPEFLSQNQVFLHLLPFFKRLKVTIDISALTKNAKLLVTLAIVAIRRIMEQSIRPDPNTYKFPIHPFKRFNKKCVEFKQPVEITCFSYDENRQLHMDDRESVSCNQFSLLLLLL